ncbi:YcgN family cysteine cluster protein [Gammaproteobacteria bacterium]|nr:YcgN family cysteine cluster protein [Gammaproteobacteria bacterium]
MDELMPFWQQKTLDQMSSDEWESLCDGCGKCCLHRLQDEEDDTLYYTNVHCRLYESTTRRCKDYENRQRRVPDCLPIEPALIASNAQWLPRTCAYRLLAEGKPLFDWHPLISGDRDSVVRARVVVFTPLLHEDAVEDLEDHVIDNPDDRHF